MKVYYRLPWSSFGGVREGFPEVIFELKKDSDGPGTLYKCSLQRLVKKNKVDVYTLT